MNTRSVPFILNTGEEMTAPDEWVEAWYRFYSVEFVDRELKRAAIWTHNNDKKRKTKKGMKRFIGSWLDSNWERGDNHRMKELT